MTKKKYDVADFYHKTGFTQWIARHPRFEHCTLSVIGLNALWIWIDTDYNPGTMLLNSPPLFQIVEYFFCVYFAFEWAMRFGAFKKKRNGLKDPWFVFDSLLVLTMVFESWIMTSVVLAVSGGGGGGLGNTSILRMARLLRLTRMARMARLLRAMPELLILIKGMVAAMRSVGFTIGLLGVILYIFAIAFVQLCEGSDCMVLFPSVIETMHILLLNGALMDSLSSLVTPLQEQHIALLLILYVFIFITSLTVMNMLIGVICEVVSAISATEREALNLGFVREKIEELMTEGGDEDGDGMISKKEFEELLHHERAISILGEVGVDGVSLLDLKDTLFASDNEFDDTDGRKLTFAEFMDLILDLRGGNSATVKDMVTLRKYIDSRFVRLEEKIKKEEGNENISMESVRGRVSARSPFGASVSDCDSLRDSIFGRRPSKGTTSPTSPSTSPKVSGNAGAMTQKVEQAARDISLRMQGLATEMATAHEREVAVLREQSVEVSTLREQNALLEAKLEKLQKYSQSMVTPAGAVCNVDIPDLVDVDRFHNVGPGDTGPDEPGEDTNVGSKSQWAFDTDSRWWNGTVRVGSLFGRRVDKATNEALQQEHNIDLVGVVRAAPDPVGPMSSHREEFVQKV